jgi:hypothetical protein
MIRWRISKDLPEKREWDPFLAPLALTMPFGRLCGRLTGVAFLDSSS